MILGSLLTIIAELALLSAGVTRLQDVLAGRRELPAPAPTTTRTPTPPREFNGIDETLLERLCDSGQTLTSDVKQACAEREAFRREKVGR